MADERISIEVDVESIKVDRQKIEEEVNELDSSLSQSVTPDVAQMYNPMFQNLRSQIASIGTALEDALSGKTVTSDIASRLNSSLSFLRANLASVKASANEVKEVFDAIPKETQAEFSKTVVDTARAAQRIVNQKGGSVATSRSVSGHATSLMQDEVFGKAYAATAEKYGLDESQSTKLLAGITRRIVPAMRNDDIVNAAIRDSKGSMQREDFVPAITNFRQRMPERYRNLPSDFSPTKKIPESKKAMYEGNLSQEEYETVKKVAESNAAFERSLERAGVARRSFGVINGVSRAGVFQMPVEPISRKQYAEALGYMVTEELVPALEGAPAFYHPITSMKAEDQKAIAAKNSKTPAAVYSAMSDLDTINVDPILMPKGTSSQSTFTGPSVALTGKGVHVNPDMYQIQSLTYEDFVGGKGLDTKAETQSVFDDKAAGRSVNKIIYQSGYTDLLGLHGNLSNGEGGKENSASPIMMQIDMSDAIRKKDAGGNIVFENGAPVIDETAKDLVAKMFEKTETYTYTRNGKEETYQYPMATFGENGVRYVPTNVKDGKITLAREADYLAAAKPWLEELGVNPFDAFESFNGEYADVNKFSKAFDVRNRNNTPSVPISSLGGAMPKSNQIAFIDDSVIKGLVPDNQAYDGAFFVMPGYIPGEAGVVRAPGLKGGAVSVNFKQMLKDLYGDQEILLPGINAPDAAKEEFLANGMQGVRAKFSEDEISKYFINPTNYEALMTDSVLKASIYKRGDTQEEMQQTFDTIMRISGGLRMHKTAADFWSSQNSLSSQVSEKLDLTPEELVANQEAWDNYITRLEHDQEFMIDTLFSDETDPLSMRIRNNPALLNQDPEAQLRIQNSLDSAKISRGYGEIFARKNANMGFAAPNVGEFLMRAGAMNNAAVANEDLAKILQMKEVVTDDDGTESILKHIAVPKLADVSAFGALRYPNNQGEQYYFENDKAYIDLLKKYGMSQDAVYMNANDLYKMGTGDFDGDTVQMLQGKLANIIRRTEMHRGNLMDRQTRTSEDLEHPAAPMNRQANGGDVADLLYRQATAMFQMGAVSNANDALSQVNMNDPKTATKWAAAAKDLELMYDIDSVFPKTGVLADWTSEAAQARKIGTPFAKLFKNLQGIVDNPTEESYRELGNFSKVNFPSVYNGLTASMLMSISKNPMTSGAVDKMIEAQSDLQNIPTLEASSKKYDQAQAAFLKLNNKTMANILTRGAIPSKETVEDLENSLGAWEAALSSKEGGFPGWKGRKDEARTEEERAAVSAYNFQKSRIAFLKSMGISEASREEGKGYAGFGFYKDNSLDTDTSVFQSAFDAEKDAQAIRIATSRGAAPDSLEATQLAAKAGLKKQSPLRIAAAKAKEKQMKYSYSMLDMFANEPEKWYDRYVNEHYDNTNTPDVLLGSVVHKVQEIWANDRIAAGGYDGARSADEYEKIFRGILSGDADIYAKYVDPKKEEASFKQLASMIGYDAKTGKFDTKATGKGFANKFNNSLNYIRNLPKMMKGLQIVGAEVKTRPEFGDAQNANVGSIDLLAWDPNTESYVIADTKAKKDPATISHAKKQIMLYNSRGETFVPASADGSEPAHFEYNDAQKGGKRPATRGMILSYGVDTKGDPSRSVTEFDINEEENAKIEAEYQERKREVAAYAARGFDRDEIKFGTYRMPNLDPERDVPSKITYSKKPKSPKKPSTKTEDNQTDMQQNQPEAQQEAQATVPPVVEIDPHSGRAVAQEITLQQDIDAYLEKMRGAQSQLISVARKADNPRVPNKWLGYEFMLNQDYDAQMQKFNAMGLAADDPRRAELVKAREDAQGAFDHALSESAIKDIERKKEELEQTYSKGEIDSSTASLTKEYDAISNSVSEATQALDFYKKKTEEIRTERAAIKGDLSVDSDESINAQLDVGEATLANLADEGKFGTDEYKTIEDANAKLIQRLEERKALVEKLKTLDADLASRDKNIEAGDAAAKDLEETKQNKLKYLQDKAADHFSNQLRGMERLTTGEELSAEDLAEIKGNDLENKIESFKKGIALMLEKGVLSQDTYDRMLNGVSNIDVDAYKNKTKEEIDYKKDQEEKAYRYKQEELARKRDDEILSTRERNEARREGKPVDKSKHEERVYEARIAELEEQRRVLDAQVWNPSATEEERVRALKQRRDLDTYIADVKENHDETLRTDAIADVRDFAEKLAKESSERGSDSVAVTYAQQFQNLNQQIEEATANYEKLKKKIESGKYTKKDSDAFSEAETQVGELKKNAKEKQDALTEQFTKDSNDKLENLQHLATGKDYTPAEIAQMKKESLQEQIASYVKGQREIGKNENIDNYTRALANIRANKAEAIDLDAYEETMREQLELEQEQKERQEELRKNRVLRQAEKRSRDPYGKRRNTWWGQVQEQKENAKYQLEDDREQLEAAISKQKSKMSHMKVGTEEYDKAKASLKELEDQLEETGKTAEKLDGPFGTASSAASKLAESARKIALSFGKKILKAALNETKQFVTEWNASMTEIQMITGKTNTEINELSATLANTAVDMRVSASEVGSAAADLYRQGLSDEDVSVRLEDVIKFSKVADITTEQASKILTTAMSNGLVDSTEEAMDAMVALGDSAATTAGEIAKGMQKSAGAAKEAKVSYSELLTMLTIITSKTQLSGSEAGTTLKSLFNRLYRVSEGEDYTDENGNRIAATDATKALQSVGINMFDDSGNFRGAYEILVELASGWEGYNDTQRNVLLQTLGAGRQSSNVATLLQGLGEDDGELANKYLNLAENSDGVTDEKYQAYYNNLAAAMENVKSSFDQLVETFDFDDMAIGFFNFIAECIQGVTALGEATANVVPVILTLGGAIAGFALSGNPLGAMIGLFAGFGVSGLIGSFLPEEEVVDGIGNLKEQTSAIISENSETDTFLNRLEELNNKGLSRTTEETEELKSGLEKLKTQFGVTIGSVDTLADSFEETANAISEARKEAAKMSAQELRFTFLSNIDDIYDQATGQIINPNSSTNRSVLSNIETIATTAEENGGSLTSYDYYAGDSVKDFLMSIDENEAVLDLMEDYGLVSAGYKKPSDLIPFLENYDGERALWAESSSARALLSLITDENGEYKYWDGKTGELDAGRASMDFIGQLYGLMAQNIPNFEAYAKENNEAVYKSYIKDSIISLLAGNADITDEQIEAYAELYASNAVSDIMTNVGTDAQNVAFQSVMLDIVDGINGVVNRSGDYVDVADYIDSNEKTWSYKAPDGTVTQGLTESEAKNLAHTDYGTRYVVGDEQFETQEAARTYITDKQELPIEKKTYTIRELLDMQENNTLEGDAEKTWNSLKEWSTPFTKESDEALAERLGSEPEREVESKTIYMYDGKEYSNAIDASVAKTNLTGHGYKIIILDENHVDEIEDPSVVYQTPIADGSSDADVSNVTQSRMAELMGNLDTYNLAYESNSNNRVRLSADKAFEAIVSNGITSLEQLGKAIDEGLITTLADVAENIPEVRKELERAFEIDEEGNWSVREGVGSTELANIIALIANGSENYTNYGSMSQSEQLTRQKDFVDDALSGKAIDAATASSLATTLGADLASKIIGASNSANVVTEERYNEFFKNAPLAAKRFGSYEEYAASTRSDAISSALSENEMQYVETLKTNAKYGVTGLFDSQKLGYRQDFVNALTNHDGQGVGALDESMRSVYTNGDATGEMLWAASAALGENGLDFDNLSQWSIKYDEACAVLETLGLTAEQVKKAISDLNDELATEGLKVNQKYGASTEDVISNMSQWGDTAKKTASGLKTLNSTVVEAENNQYYRDRYRSGARDDDTVKAIAEQTGFDESDVKDGKQSVKDMLDIVEAADIEEFNNQIDALNEAVAQDITLTAPTITMLNNGSVDLETVLSQMEAEAAAQLLASYNSLIEKGYEVKLETYEKSDGTMGARIVPISNNISSIQGKKKSGSGGGGGGSGKSAATKLIESQDHETTLREHIIKMIQYEETRYQNADELTNYGIMLQHEIDEEERQTKVIEQNIEALKSQMAQTSKGSDDWYSLREAILKAEESLAEMNNTIEENKKKLKENEQAILKLHTDLEQEVKGEIETRINEEKDMLDGQVSMEQTILDAIKHRYEEEWELMQKDIDKKKKALQEEIDLIDERLQRRKDAEDEAEKYEELAEYKKQLALISTDSTRTKDQAELREKIADLEKELAWDKAEEEADIQKEGLQDQIDAYDEYVDDYQEYLDDLLENANNFADEVNSVMQMSHEDMIAWLQKNVEEYTNSLEASQKQMTQGWDETFKQMKGIIDTFWEEIAQKLSSKESFLEYMKQSSSYQNASDDEKAQMEYNWETMYDSWISAKKTSQEAIDYSHTDETLDGSGTADSGSTSGKYGVSVSVNGKTFNPGKIYGTKTAALNAGRAWVDRAYASAYVGLDDEKNAQQIASIDASVIAAKNRIYVYKKGGIVDYTGPAWVDGTKSQPEAFLSAEDTQMIRTLIDGWKYVAMRPTITSIDGLLKEGNAGNTIGDVYVTLNEAQFNTDDDYETIAQKVGEAFTKELAKNGFSTASYSF